MRALYHSSGPAGEYAEGDHSLNFLNGCPHGCVFCYVPDVVRKKRADFHANCTLRADLFKKVGLDLAELRGRGERIFLSFTHDPLPFGRPELHKIFWLLVQQIHKSGNYVRVLTRNPGALLDHPELLIKGDVVMTSMVFSKTKAGEHWEPNAPSSMARRVAFEQLRELRPDVKLGVSFEPIIDPAQTLLMAEKMAPVVDFMWFGPLNHESKLAPGYREFIPAVNWPEFHHQLRDLMARLKFRDWRLKEGLKELTGEVEE